MLRLQNYFKFFALLAVVMISAGLNAQTLSDATALVKEGQAAMGEEKIDVAVQKFEEAIVICEDLYEEEEDMETEALMEQIKPTLPGLCYKAGLSLAKSKDLEGSLEYLDKAMSYAEEYNSPSDKEKAAALASKIHYSTGGAKYKAAVKDGNKNQEMLDAAIIDLDKAIEMDPNNLSAYKLKTGILIMQEKDDELASTTKKVMDVRGNISDRDAIIDKTAAYFYNKGGKAKQSSNYSEALDNIKKSLEFDSENTEAYYVMATVYNAQKKWDEAISSANEGLKYESAVNQARFYFELGTAYFGKGDKASACDAYSKASTGDYKENAEYQKKYVVKCD
jgi:tetratricopeptide (TPR) repeat protein